MAEIRALLANFREASPIDARIDDDDLAQYGLDPNHRIVVEIFTDSDQPELSFQIGYDVEASSGASFIKLSGSDHIYRGYVGGRKRFEKAAVIGEIRVLFGFEGETVTALQVIKQDGSGLNIQKNLEAQLWTVVNAPCRNGSRSIPDCQSDAITRWIECWCVLGKDLRPLARSSLKFKSSCSADESFSLKSVKKMRTGPPNSEISRPVKSQWFRPFQSER